MTPTPFIEQEDKSYSEAIISLGGRTSPILKARAVKKSDDTYEAVVRDCHTGEMLSSQVGGYSKEIAENVSIILCQKLLKSASKECIITGKMECPFDEISHNKHCFWCTLPDRGITYDINS